MAVTTTFAESFVEEIWQGEHDVTSDTIKVALMDTTFTFDPESDATWADVSAHQITSAGGYAAITLTPIAVAATVAAGDGYIDVTTSAPTVCTWTASGAAMDSTIGAIIYNDTHASDALIAYIDFDGTYTTSDGAMFRIDFTNGIFRSTITIP